MLPSTLLPNLAVLLEGNSSHSCWTQWLLWQHTLMQPIRSRSSGRGNMVSHEHWALKDLDVSEIAHPIRYFWNQHSPTKALLLLPQLSPKPYFHTLCQSLHAWTAPACAKALFSLQHTPNYPGTTLAGVWALTAVAVSPTATAEESNTNILPVLLQAERNTLRK